MMASFDEAAMLPELPINHLHHSAKARWYTLLPALHVGVSNTALGRSIN